MRIPKTTFAVSLLSTLFTTSVCGQAPKSVVQTATTSNDHPANIVFILADDLGYGHLGAYGQTVLDTPNIDQLASDGIQFMQAYSGSTVCAPSRSVLMTGRHTGHTTVRSNFGPDGERIPLRDNDVTIAEVLKRAGYSTGMVGKWGLGEPGSTGLPNDQGFDYWFGFLNQHHAHSYYPSYVWRNDQVIYLNENENGQRNTYIQDVFVEEAMRFIENNKKGPFFLYLSLTLPHSELAAPDDLLSRYKGRFSETPLPAMFGRPSVEEPKAVYAAMVAAMDRDVGRIRSLLRDLEIEDNTLLIFTSDNGPANEEGVLAAAFDGSGGLRGIKRDLYEGGIRIPFIANWPHSIQAGIVDDTTQIAFWDVLPTLADIARTDPPEEIDGKSFAQTLLGLERQTEARYLYWEFLHEKEGRLLQAARRSQWKAVRLGADYPIELYDLAEDPSESRDVSQAHLSLVAEFAAFFATAR